MIHYHGTPITPNETLLSMKGKHFFISFWRPDNIGLISKIAQSFAIDNGAFSAWRKGIKVDWMEYKDFVQKWERHPGCDWHVIPDVIDGTEADNDKMLDQWQLKSGVPVWHMHESLDRLKLMVNFYDRISLGSSGDYSTVGTDSWWARIN